MSARLFHAIPDAFAIIKKGGVYKQAALFYRGERVYAETGGGYARIGKHGTSVPNLEVDGDLEIDPNLIAEEPLGWYVYIPARTTNKLRAV